MSHGGPTRGKSGPGAASRPQTRAWRSGELKRKAALRTGAAAAGQGEGSALLRCRAAGHSWRRCQGARRRPRPTFACRNPAPAPFREKRARSRPCPRGCLLSLVGVGISVLMCTAQRACPGAGSILTRPDAVLLARTGNPTCADTAGKNLRQVCTSEPQPGAREQPRSSFWVGDPTCGLVLGGPHCRNGGATVFWTPDLQGCSHQSVCSQPNARWFPSTQPVRVLWPAVGGQGPASAALTSRVGRTGAPGAALWDPRVLRAAGAQC